MEASGGKAVPQHQHYLASGAFSSPRATASEGRGGRGGGGGREGLAGNSFLSLKFEKSLTKCHTKSWAGGWLWWKGVGVYLELVFQIYPIVLLPLSLESYTRHSLLIPLRPIDRMGPCACTSLKTNCVFTGSIAIVTILE